jgi:hypothetical protein
VQDLRYRNYVGNDTERENNNAVEIGWNMEAGRIM